MSLIKANFGGLTDLTNQIRNTVTAVNQEMDTWRSTAGATSADWLDNAGGQFTEVSAAWDQVSAAQQAMLEALGGGVDTTNTEMQAAVQSSAARIGNITI